tara:strand:- start:156 stop:509 length:354 start_codon:yes stop_codon:yes gene_type:complete
LSHWGLVVSEKEKALGLSEGMQVKANLAFMAKTITLVGTAVWGYSVIWNKINTIENDLVRMKHEMDLNSEFRVKWPRGEIGALPADAQQNMSIEHLKDRVDKLDEHVDTLRLGAVAK